MTPKQCMKMEAQPAAPCSKCSGHCVPTPPVDTVDSSRRGFLKNTGMLSISSLLGTAALMTNSDDAKANMEWAE